VHHVLRSSPGGTKTLIPHFGLNFLHNQNVLLEVPKEKKEEEKAEIMYLVDREILLLPQCPGQPGHHTPRYGYLCK
jgi:hypothetical protein